MLLRRKRAPWLVAAGVALAIGAMILALTRDRIGETPAGQSPATALTLSNLQSAFNAASPATRVLVLLSPT